MVRGRKLDLNVVFAIAPRGGRAFMIFFKSVWCVFLPGAELAEGLEGCGGHIAQSSIVAQQQESQHLEPQQHKHILKIEYATEHITAGLEKPGRDVRALNTAS